MCYSFTNSKSYLAFLGGRSPGGSYTYISNWLKEQSQEPLTYAHGLIKSAFDNSQKVGKTYLITETNTVKTSVIASYLWITLDPNLQEKILYRPNNWMLEMIEASKKEEMTSLLTTPLRTFGILQMIL